MDLADPPEWLQETLQFHFTGEELRQIQANLQAELWMSPAFRKSRQQSENIPLRFHLDIDMKG
ncbi:hypothetical protein GXN76_07750 [Kroppenstedtia pulmonis]|uniref:Uncharacterized protein n=1 Tax=Kroppenstedtia pulmonis TaxID=1380685 RepID=A0A7D3Y9N4_9BACL|nr:hypothetical protein [Kroppenstedtia pulmonis]QKG84381.1 hypothetical protein GXN76_07750 [Kroppenstedtia pulmonis]